MVLIITWDNTTLTQLKASITSQKKLIKIKRDFIIRFQLSRCKIRSTKFEIRNNFKIQIFQFFKGVLDFDHLIFGFVSHFDIRISDLGCRFSGSPAIVQIMQVITVTLH